MRPALVVVAKQPEPGRVKTRLSPPLSPDEAAALAQALLDDTVRACLSVTGADLFLGYASSSGSSDWFAARFPCAGLLPQGEGDLGARMARLFESVLGAHAAAVLVGADLPLLTAARIEAALDALTTPGSVVLGPALDGGYYLVGLRRPQPALFAPMAWSTPGVLAETLQRARGAGLSATLLPPERDLDTPSDLEWLETVRTGLPAGSAVASWLDSPALFCKENR